MFLDKYLNRKAFTALLVGSILAIMIGSVLLVISYVVINAIIGSTGSISNAALNTSLYANITNITAALNIAGISLIVELSKSLRPVGQKGFFNAELGLAVSSICSSASAALVVARGRQSSANGLAI
jgi:hypothetical protein